MRELPVAILPRPCQDRGMLGEPEGQFFLTRAARKRKFSWAGHVGAPVERHRRAPGNSEEPFLP
jgi:hypothetical protein